MKRFSRFATISKFQKYEKHPRRSVTFSKVAGFGVCSFQDLNFIEKRLKSLQLY